MPEPDEPTAWIERERTPTESGERIRLPARDPLPTWARVIAGLLIATGFFFGLIGGVASILLVAVLAGAMMIWRSTRWELELDGAEVRLHRVLDAVSTRAVVRVESSDRTLRIIGDSVIDVAVENGPPGLAHALAAHVRERLQVAPGEQARGLDRWTRVRVDGAEIDLSPLDAPLPLWLTALIALGAGSVPFLPLVAETPLTYSFLHWVAAALTGSVFAALATIATLWLQAPRCRVRIDGRRVRITRTRRFGERHTDIPLASIRSIKAGHRGVQFETDAGPVYVRLPGRSHATRAELAARIEVLLHTARDPGSASDVPAALLAARAATERS